MSEIAMLSLARACDACAIAEMSRDLVEQGLGWSWTPARVHRSISSKDACVVIARRDARIAAFAIMHFGEDVAHLNLLAVQARHRRQGLGRRLLEWLFATALEAGVFRINLELRADNAGARDFYKRLGFEPLDTVPGYYQGRESAMRMTRRLP
jgi:[ribosomal protein S18]-alanine N-acetyltransferase